MRTTLFYFALIGAAAAAPLQARDTPSASTVVPMVGGLLKGIGKGVTGLVGGILHGEAAIGKGVTKAVGHGLLDGTSLVNPGIASSLAGGASKLSGHDITAPSYFHPKPNNPTPEQGGTDATPAPAPDADDTPATPDVDPSAAPDDNGMGDMGAMPPST